MENETDASTRPVSGLVAAARESFKTQLVTHDTATQSGLLRRHEVAVAAFNNAITELVVVAAEQRTELATLRAELECERLKHRAAAELALRGARSGMRYK